MKLLRARRGRTAPDRRPAPALRSLCRTLSVIAVVAAGAGLFGLSSASLARAPLSNAPRADALTSSAAATQAPPTAPAGDPTAAISAPADGSTVASGTAVTLSARGSSDLVSALQAGTPRRCYFTIGDNANSTATGTLDVNTATCTASWTFGYKAAFTIVGWFTTASTIGYATPAVTLNVTGPDSVRCTGATAGCTYRWADVYYTSSTTFTGRVCGVDACQWGSTHTAWTQVTGTDYWLNRTGTMSSGDVAEAYLCIGSSSADWSTYASGHNFAGLLAQAETSANPLPSGTCTG